MMCYFSKWWPYVLAVVLLYCVDLGHGGYYRQLNNRRSGDRGPPGPINRGPPGPPNRGPPEPTRPMSSSLPLASFQFFSTKVADTASSPARVAGPGNTGGRPGSRGNYYQHLLRQVRGKLGHSKKRGAPPPALRSGPSPSLALTITSFSLSSDSSSSAPPSEADRRMLADIAAMIPPGGTVNDIPKSQWTALTGDIDYTQFRQLFLRQLCQRMVNGERAHAFQFCFSILQQPAPELNNSSFR